ncbi:MAG: hypothetical protein AAB906_04065 [Patescibacteria group bacterium]
MPEFNPQFLLSLETLIFASVILMHLVKKSSSMISLYILQSAVVVFLLLTHLFSDFSFSLLAVIILVFAVKVLVAPRFFFKLINRHQLKFTISNFLNSPLTLIVLAVLTAVSHSGALKPLVGLAGGNGDALLISISVILISLFLIVNKRGALSQMIGILSLENGIVSFAFLMGLEQAPALELGIIFDILVWIIIASVFASMIYKQFGSLDVTSMKHLKE